MNTLYNKEQNKQLYIMNQKEIILEQLNAMGFEPVELGDAGFVFKYDDLNYLYMPDEDDEQFLRIAIPHLFEVTDENRVAVLEAMHDTSLLLKYAKVNIMYESAAWAVYEHRLTTTDNLSELLEHIIRVLEAAAHVFYKKINGEEVAGRSDEPSDDDLEAELQKMLDSIEEESN